MARPVGLTFLPAHANNDNRETVRNAAAAMPSMRVLW